MYDKIDSDEDSWETLKQFCLKIGEGRVEHHKEEIHYTTLYHPTKPDEMLIVHYSRLHDTIYIRETAEEGTMFELDKLPLVHSFSVQKRRHAILPYAVDICRWDKDFLGDEAIYYYTEPAPDTIPASMDIIMSVKVPLDRYERFTKLFDEVNPMPWTERQNPEGKLPPPGLPGLPDSVE
ncbi:MAG: hypothetical protein KAX31_05410 [Thermoplasmata archaeon]|nr:hypothetical protein [Thermoplasmata archaeon]